MPDRFIESAIFAMDDGWDILDYEVAWACNFGKSCNTLVKVVSFIIAPSVVI